MAFEAGAIASAVRDGVPDGPDRRCFTCAHWDDIEMFRVPTSGGSVLFCAGHCMADGSEPPRITGELDGAACPHWREVE